MNKKELLTLGEIDSVKVTHDVVLLDESDPRSLINLVSEKFRTKMRILAEKHPEYFSMSERQLYLTLKPSDTDDKFRLLFWKEYNRAQDNGTTMRMPNVYSPVMSREGYNSMIDNIHRIAWIIKPPEEYMISLEAALNKGRENIERIMTLNLFDKKGKFLKGEAQIFLKAYELLENRVKGAVVQRMEQKMASLHVHAKQPAITGEDIQLLEKLREQQESVVDVTKKITDTSGD
jgi:hypothetical protein